jgi:2-oxoglutarate ferredoxin oxidoreductase subunit delta
MFFPCYITWNADSRRSEQKGGFFGVPERNSEKVDFQMGKIIVNRERCKACALCTLACPKKLILFSQEANSQGFYPAELSSDTECTGCTLCAEACPDVAIEVWR